MDLNTLKQQAQEAMSKVNVEGLKEQAMEKAAELGAGLKDAAMAAKDSAMAKEGDLKDKLADAKDAFMEKAGDVLGSLGSKATDLADKLK